MMMLIDDCFRKGVRKGEELKAPRYASAAATRDYIITRDIISNNFKIKYIKDIDNIKANILNKKVKL